MEIKITDFSLIEKQGNNFRGWIVYTKKRLFRKEKAYKKYFIGELCMQHIIMIRFEDSGKSLIEELNFGLALTVSALVKLNIHKFKE